MYSRCLMFRNTTIFRLKGVSKLASTLVLEQLLNCNIKVSLSNLHAVLSVTSISVHRLALFRMVDTSCTHGLVPSTHLAKNIHNIGESSATLYRILRSTRPPVFIFTKCAFRVAINSFVFFRLRYEVWTNS